MSPVEELLVLGAGVSGLTCALSLLSAGRRCRVWTRDMPEQSTSRVAGALWYPFRVGPPAAVQRWAPIAHTMFSRLAQHEDPALTGVRTRETLELFPGRPLDPHWRAELPGFRAARRDELGPQHQSGWVYNTPVIDTSLYLPFLRSRIENYGVSLEQRTCGSLEEAWEAARTVVNTTGLGSRELCNDHTLTPVRGQLLRVQRSPSLTRVVLDEHSDDAVRYVVPMEHGCVLGGSVEPGQESQVADPALSAAISSDCRKLVPELGDPQLIETRVGLRPCRDEVRLELETRGDLRVVHNYGHGGAGVTLSWGCASELLGHLGLELRELPWLEPKNALA